MNYMVAEENKLELIGDRPSHRPFGATVLTAGAKQAGRHTTEFLQPTKEGT